MTKQHVGTFVFCFCFLFLVILQVSALLPFVAEQQENLSFGKVGDQSLFILLHPVETVASLIENHNPLFYGGSVAVFLYALYFSYKMGGRKKDGWQVDPKEQSHGSARLAQSNDIFTSGEFNAATQQQAFDELKESLESYKGES